MQIPSDALLARYLAGDCSPTGARDVERWLADDPAHVARLDELRLIWDARRPLFTPDIDAMWAGVRRTMRADHARSARLGRTFRFGEPERRWSSPVAAAAALVLAVGAALIASRALARAPAASTIEPMREYATPRGQRATFQLADGSRLMLAADSRLRVPANYGRGVREVYLEGEALFEVVHDSTRPFRVRAGHAVVEDIGTKFDVRAYSDDAAVGVAVAEGAVALGRASPAGTETAGSADVAHGVVLRTGELGTLDPKGRVTTARGAAAAAYLAWAEGRLPFLETPLPEVLRVVGRWYDLDMRVEGKALASRAVTAEFGAQSAEDVLKALALAVGARVVRQGRVVTLRSK